jgi:hypothetical protein
MTTFARGDRWTAIWFYSIATSPGCGATSGQSSEIEQLIAADLDCTPAAQRLMRAQADLILYVEKRERLVAPVPCD